MYADPLPFPSLKIVSQYFTASFDYNEPLSFAESLIILNATPKRVADFKAGRYCARQALLAFTEEQIEILQGKGRQPLWPKGFTGSISHSSKLAGAVVARETDIAAMGLDIEYMNGVKQDMWQLLFNDAEQALIYCKPDASLWASLFFSFKESFYKMQYPVTYQFLEFTDITISTTGDNFLFTPANPDHDLSAIDFDNIKTQWTMVADQLITLCYI
ncbi:4'-phosphopantetheinyl transferase family protein [Mucilaginibacter pineti]|nr:4'-phosphopantetheinyl transferase superfamily protein [Mucilaginibacter pineti]